MVLNPGWAAAGSPAVPAQYAQLVASFQVVYSFLPISVKVRAAASGRPGRGVLAVSARTPPGSRHRLQCPPGGRWSSRRVAARQEVRPAGAFVCMHMCLAAPAPSVHGAARGRVTAQGLIGNKEGAVLRWAKNGLAGATWQILVQQGERFVQVRGWRGGLAQACAMGRAQTAADRLAAAVSKLPTAVVGRLGSAPCSTSTTHHLLVKVGGVACCCCCCCCRWGRPQAGRSRRSWKRRSWWRRPPRARCPAWQRASKPSATL